MNILYVGDIMAEPGMRVVETLLPAMRREYEVDVVIAQAENVTAGKGLSLADFARLKKMGVDFFTGGNHSLAVPEIIPMLEDPSQPVIRPANYPAGTPGQGWKYLKTPQGQVLIVSLLGAVVGRQADDSVDNPLAAIDTILSANQGVERVATIINFHGDYSSEKVIIGHYLDGRATLVVGDHWHVPTADARLLPKGTGHITDVGMCGTLNDSLGISLDSVIPRWRHSIQTRNQLATAGPLQFNAVLVASDSRGLATSIQQIRKIVE